MWPWSLPRTVLSLSFLSVCAYSLPHLDGERLERLRPRAETPQIETTEGPIQGSVVDVPGSSNPVYQYLGVPFAVTPPERFSPPQPASQRTDVLEATNPSPACIQQFNYPEKARDFIIEIFATPPPPSESEDCLYLNVYTPSSEPPSGGFPVMFWIYGGNLQIGYDTIGFYNGSYFAAFQDVIVVATNFRANVFGFPNAPELQVGEQNPGFLDQRMALKWTADNIVAFGGDPSKITIFGESGGGYSVKQLVAVPPEPLTFQAAIMESEAAFFINSDQSWQKLLDGLNCTNATDTFACARAAPATTLKSVIEHEELYFAPVKDDITESSSVSNAITSGTAAQVPILIGTNANDGSVFSYYLSLTLTSFVDEYFRSMGLTQANIDGILDLYPRSQYSLDTDVIGAIITDAVFQCPAAAIAGLTAARDLSVYRYLFDASFPNSQVREFYAGAWHATEIPEVFRTYNRDGATEQQVALSEYMNTAWANFAKNPTSQPMSDWPDYRQAVFNIQTFQNQSNGFNVAGPQVSAFTADAKCSAYAPLLAITGL